MRLHTRAMRRRGFEMRASSYQPKGQVSIFVVLAMALFLLGFIGFAVDMTNLWFHRQMAQGAADAACQAGVMDVLLMAQGSSPPSPGFIPGVAFDCTSSPTAVPCRYADLNGYNGTGLIADTPSNQVAVSFPGTVPGTTPPDPALAPIPFLRVDVVERVGLTFASLILGRRTGDVRAFAECAVLQAQSPIPIIVLNPVCPHSFEVSGSTTVRIEGGPSKSVQVNSNSTYPAGQDNCAAATVSSDQQCTGSGTVDLSEGGPNFSGSVFGTFGGQSPAPPNFLPGQTGAWVSPASPIADPFAMLPAPPVPPLAPAPVAAAYGEFGCPDQTGNDPDGDGIFKGPISTPGCIRYQPGLYTSPIIVKGYTAIFDPGIYYIAPDNYAGAQGGGYCGKGGCIDIGTISGQCRAAFLVESNGVVRVSTGPGDGTEGVIFYLSGAPGGQYGSAFFGSNAGKYGGRLVDPYEWTGTSTSRQLQCPFGGMPNPPPPDFINGNVLLAPCSGPYGDPLGVSRRMLFFQDRANGDFRAQPTFQGGGGLLLAGTLYFHNCPNSPDCSPGYAETYRAFVQLQGNPGSETRVIGNIVTDQLVLAGTAEIDMILDPNSVFNILKASLVR